MKHTYKEKVEILRSVLLEYSKYFKYFRGVKLFDLGLRFWIIFTEYIPTKFCDGDFTRKIRREEIDNVIARYRSKLDYEIKKHHRELDQQLNNLSWRYSIQNLK